MHCQYCGSINGEDDHRCLRCGRRMAGIVIAAPTSYIGATALAVSAEPREDVWALQDRMPEQAVEPVRAQGPEQPPLFGGEAGMPTSNLIPFETIQRPSTGRFAQPPSAAPRQPAPPANTRATAKRPTTPASQATLDLRPGSSQSERTLPTGVLARVSGNGHVAPPMRRITAGAMDVAMVLIGFGAFAIVAHFAGPLIDSDAASVFGTGRAMWVTLALAMTFISFFYGLIFAMARRETAGMNWTDLRLVTFDGSPLETRDRVIRFASAWLSYCSAGLGLLWALADEENLAFHDHISKTYPAEKDTRKGGLNGGAPPSKPRR